MRLPYDTRRHPTAAYGSNPKVLAQQKGKGEWDMETGFKLDTRLTQPHISNQVAFVRGLGFL